MVLKQQKNHIGAGRGGVMNDINKQDDSGCVVIALPAIVLYMLWGTFWFWIALVLIASLLIIIGRNR